VADIHFDHQLALAALAAGADGLRINPGNIGGQRKLLSLVARTAELGCCLRVGVNAGSLEKDLLAKHGRPCSEALAESALRVCRAVERTGFHNFKVSLKSSNVQENYEAHRLFAAESEVPLHVGLTEAGPLLPGLVKSALGLGFILAEGLGATIRVSLTRDPVEEVRAGYEILRALGLRSRGVEIISCPTCGRTEVDLFRLVEEVEAALAHVTQPLKVAVMGCVVNGPGEAREADLGVAGGRGTGLLFRRGEKLRKVAETEIVPALVALVEAEAERK
jgi:(E)-4-hydroxy-3-methylbut-2-enyl-diphosphate synthase